MRPSRLITVLGGTLLAALLLPSVALAGVDPAGSAATGAAPATAPSIELHCALVIPAGHPARERIACHWSALTGVDVRVYRLWRFVDAPLGPRGQVIARVAPGEPLRHVDLDIRGGHRYSYRVVAIGQDGSRVGMSALVSLRVGRPAEKLSLRCVYVIDGAKQGVACTWSRSTRPAAVRYVLFRSVDGAARERIDRIGLHERRAFLDTDVKAGQAIRYKVVALAADGRVVGAGMDRIVVPTVVSALSQR
jgi:hypothetical protein